MAAHTHALKKKALNTQLLATAGAHTLDREIHVYIGMHIHRVDTAA